MATAFIPGHKKKISKGWKMGWDPRLRLCYSVWQPWRFLHFAQGQIQILCNPAPTERLCIRTSTNEAPNYHQICIKQRSETKSLMCHTNSGILWQTKALQRKAVVHARLEIGS